MKCNCGNMMDRKLPLIGEKFFECPYCKATLIVDDRGLIKWSDKNGHPATYMPK